MTVRIPTSSIASNRIGAFVFPAEDEKGLLQIWITMARWDRFWVHLPEPATDEERLDFALRRLEQAADKDDASSTADGGVRIRFVG